MDHHRHTSSVVYNRLAIFLIILLNHIVKISTTNLSTPPIPKSSSLLLPSSYYKYNVTNSLNSIDSNLLIKTINPSSNSKTSSSSSSNSKDYMDLEEYIARNEVNDNTNNNIVLPPFTEVPFTEEKRRNRRHTYITNLCKSDCMCVTDSTKKFLNAECTFLDKQAPYVIGRLHIFPKDIRSLKIKLAKDIRLIFEPNSFIDATLNSLVIEGNPNGKEHIEIQGNAFLGNAGTFPEVNITNCHTVILRKKSFSNITRLNEFILNVYHAENVNIYKEAFSNTKFLGNFAHIHDLRIPEGGFAGATESNILISYVNMDTFDKLESSLKGITVTHSNIKTIKSEAFNVISVAAITFQNCNIGTIEKNVFTQKLYSNRLEFSNCKIDVIKAQAIDQSGVNRIIFEYNEIRKIEKNAISVSVVNMSLSFNSIKFLQYHWLKISNIWQNVTIFNNTFGELDALKIEGTTNPLQCIFEKNSITSPKAGCLNETNYHCKIRETYFYTDCTCNLNWIMILSRVNIRDESYCRIDEVLKQCFNASVFNVEKYRMEVCGDSKDIINCMENQNRVKTSENFIEPEESNGGDGDNQGFTSRHLIYLGIGVASLILFVVLVALISMTAIICYRGRKISIPLGQMTTQKPTDNEPLKFSNNDRTVIKRTLELMKDKHPPEKYNQVYDLTQKLLNEDLTESQKVAAIGNIIEILGECENTGEDFTAFTGILYNHLAPRSSPRPAHDTDINQDDPIYAEINQPNYKPVGVGQPKLFNRPPVDLSSIYSEPNNVQQPLLHNIYASPLDRHNETTDIYAEPVLNELEKTVITPYAIGNQLSTYDNKPSTSKNLPDVLSQSQQQHHHVESKLPTVPTAPSPAMTNVKKIASNFANDPNFHIIRSPITNRRIPQYTIPSKSITNVPSGGASAPPASSSYKKNKSVNSKTNNNDSDSSNSHHSDYSGGSDITFKIDEIEYADA